jgi:hypothetical protein
MEIGPNLANVLGGFAAAIGVVGVAWAVMWGVTRG